MIVTSCPSSARSMAFAPSPINNTVDAVALSSSEICSLDKCVISGVATFASTSSRASRARVRCSFIALSKPAWSIVKPASEAISSVNSQGNP